GHAAGFPSALRGEGAGMSKPGVQELLRRLCGSLLLLLFLLLLLHLLLLQPLQDLRRNPGWRAGRARRTVEALDLGALAQLGDEFGLRAAPDISLDLVLDLVEFGHRPLALLLHLDDVPAELRLHRIGE